MKTFSDKRTGMSVECGKHSVLKLTTHNCDCSVKKSQVICKGWCDHPICVDCEYSWDGKWKTFNYQHKECQTCIHNQKLLTCNFKRE